MARGWESKSVESQQDAALSAEKKEAPQDLEKKHQRESLELSRRRILHELEETKSDARKTQLQAALKFLEDEIAKV